MPPRRKKLISPLFQSSNL